MRTIRFMAQRVDNKQFIAGSLKILSETEVFIIARQGIVLDFCHEVFPESVEILTDSGEYKNLNQVKIL